MAPREGLLRVPRVSLQPRGAPRRVREVPRRAAVNAPRGAPFSSAPLASRPPPGSALLRGSDAAPAHGAVHRAAVGARDRIAARARELERDREVLRGVADALLAVDGERAALGAAQEADAAPLVA
ncbi:MAG: hypothetical protein ACK559_05515, partial [bacterium]